MNTPHDAIRIHKEDSVAVAVRPLPQGCQVTVEGQAYTLQNEIPFGHKFALRDIAEGERVIKYGHTIGYATSPIRAGEWVHVHNVKTSLSGQLAYTYEPVAPHREDTAGCPDTFEGYCRPDGSVGIRNELWILPTVSCVNPTINTIARKARERYAGRCDGIYAFPHNAGCSQLGDDHQMTQRLLRSIVKNPNAGGVLLVSLGCENNNLSEFLPVLGPVDESRVKWMISQEVEDEVEHALELIGQILDAMDQDRRQTVPASKLRLGFKCGGSDAFSGITANPLCGRITDRVTALGGTAVLTEVPEMFGAEQSLMNRAADEETFQKVVDLINGFKQYYLDYNQPIYENPSPGNKEGGITTLEEKSLGCIQKGGSAVVTDTLDYGQQCSKPGLNLMTGPGNDSVSLTDLLAAGVQMILFTTGRGNPLGSAVPVIKVASNSGLAARKKTWIDFNAGQLLEGASGDEVRDQLWQLVLDTASGKYITRNEENDNREIMIFKNGVML